MDKMLKKAEAFSKDKTDLLEYIKNILNDSTFQANPKEYLKKWRERRGFTKEIRRPEDQARVFFDQNFKY